MKTYIFSFLLFFSLSASEAFISATSLQKYINDNSKLIILDVGNYDLYTKGHIPMARHVSVRAWCKTVDDHYEMQSIERLEKLAQDLGIEEDSYIVLYDHNSPNGLLRSSYIALALYRLGLTNISLLNGSYEEWTYEYEGVRAANKVTPSTFKAKPKDDLIVNCSYVEQRIGKVVLLDARVSKHYFGIYKSPGAYRLGHIKGASSTYWKNSFLSDNTLAEREILEGIYLKGLKLKKEDEIILYGEDGYEASMNWYILSRVFGFENLRVYDASMLEWGNQEKTPMVAYAWE